MKLNWILRLPWQADRSLSDLLWQFNHKALKAYEPITLLKRAIPESIPVKVTEILPRTKDGGAFVRFSHPDKITLREVEGRLSQKVREEGKSDEK